MREDQSVPFQFIHEAAACGMFYTKDNHGDYANLLAKAQRMLPDQIHHGSDTHIRSPSQPFRSGNITHGMLSVAKFGGPYSVNPTASSGALTGSSSSIGGNDGSSCTYSKGSR